MYPSDNQEVFLPAAQKAEKASFEKAILHYAEDGTPKLQISYQARETLNAEVAWYGTIVCMGPAAAFVYRLRSGRTS